MKYLLYFHFYTVFCGDSINSYPISTVLAVKQDTIIFYSYDVGYIRWKINKTEKEDIRKDYSHYYKNRKMRRDYIDAIYFASFKDLRAIIIVRSRLSSKAEIKILTAGKPIIIQLKE